MDKKRVIQISNHVSIFCVSCNFYFCHFWTAEINRVSINYVPSSPGIEIAKVPHHGYG